DEEVVGGRTYRPADEATDEGATHGADEAPHGAEWQQAGVPGQGHEDVAPAPLGCQSDRADAEARPEAEGERLGGSRHTQGDELDDHGLGDVEREVEQRPSEDWADEHAQGPP